MSLMPQDRSKLSPMMQQYLSMKDEHRDQILMFRLGDFYEMFFDDAVTASRELELTLTGRDCGLPDRAPMCGVPYHGQGLGGPGHYPGGDPRHPDGSQHAGGGLQ